MSKELEILEEISKEEVLFKDRNTVYMGGEKVNSFTYKDTIGNHFKGIEDIKQALIEYKFLKECFSNFEDHITPITTKEYNNLIKKEQAFDEIVEYFMQQGNIECLFRNALLGIPYQKYCENCKDEIKLTNPIDKETYDNLSKYFKKKEEEKDGSKYSY